MVRVQYKFKLTEESNNQSVLCNVLYCHIYLCVLYVF